jgi:hypothetical protein
VVFPDGGERASLGELHSQAMTMTTITGLAV